MGRQSDHIFLGRPVKGLTIGQIVSEAAARWGAKTYLHDLSTDRRYSYADLDRISAAWGLGLRTAGIGKGRHVALMLNNSADMLLLYYALARVGAVVAPLNPEARGDLLAYYLDLCDATVLIAEAAVLVEIDGVIARPGSRITTLICRSEVPKLVAKPGCRVLAFDDIRRPEGRDKAPEALRFDDPACLALTSGSTGPSKAVLFSQATMLMIAQSYAMSYRYSTDDVYYICLPLFHTSGLRGAAYVALLTGGAVALSSGFSVSRFWDDIARSGATTFDLLGAMATFLWRADHHPLERQHRVRMVRVAPVPPFGRGFEERFGLRLVSTYGLTDGGAPVARTLDDPDDKFFAAGRLREGFELRILDAQDFPLPRGVAGQIAIRATAPWLMPSGYHKNASATVAAWTNGWFHTGDCGYVDADGYLYFTGRLKEVIRRRGENVSAWEVEQVIAAHEDVQIAAVYPVRSPWGEDEVAASVVPRAGRSLTVDAVRDHCERLLMKHMRPSVLEIVSDLPMTPSQKIDKATLQARATVRIGGTFKGSSTP